MCVILSANPPFSAAAALSPPPIIVVASISAKTSAILFVPTAKLSNSNTPIGPFHTTVFALFNSSANISTVAGPISNPSQSAGISFDGTTFLSASFENSVATILSIGNKSFTPLASAFASNSFAKSTLSSSQIDLPTSYPLALKNVYAIPPPIINVSTLSIKFSITLILSETFFPPKIATNGLTGSVNAPPITSISFLIKYPHTAGK